ncbi:MAG: nicotinate-nucleotide diphosphorylase (carboxylating) [Candidatus Latescibacteria bacterium 4484_107]|nr:MAG: nicotinate-nucleotide diphosphorylase (carboxylating) [Candidatus Latescibacteria bacterium 4484_107]
MDSRKLRRIVRSALEEDVGAGDVTSEWTVGTEALASGRMIAKEAGVVCGLDVARLVFQELDREIDFTSRVRDGDRVTAGDGIARIEGPARGILTGERVALNFLQRMSGIATMTARYAEAVRGTGARILDTRKTTPGLRMLEKYAVRCGGGENHRFGLYDMVLIKDNHIAASGGIGEAVQNAKCKMQSVKCKMPIEVEVKNLSELADALEVGVDRIMLDNMSVEEMRQAVEEVRKVSDAVEIEASGGVTLAHLREIAETGVDFISVGALTHSPQALDVSLIFHSR